jgi:redox-sensitive bicupin YhaK (pirin superfamily)
VLESGDTPKHEFASGRHGWLQVARGGVVLNGETLKAGDGAAIAKEDTIQLANANGEKSEVILFDLA